MNPLLVRTSLRVVTFLVITSIGGLIFSEIEHNTESNFEDEDDLLEALRKDMETKYNMSAADFENFTQLSYNALTPAGPAWTYFDGLRFSFETLTTIGYGGLSPVTSLGQVICMVFAVLGIPVTILAFQSVGELINDGINFLIAKIEKKCLQRDPCHVEMKCMAATSVLMIAMLFLGAALQMFTDQWTFLEGFYFWFITFTTIGYGDYIPGHPQPAKGSEKPNSTAARLKSAGIRSTAMAFHITWTTLGLCVVSSVLNALAAFIEKRQRCRAHALGCLDTQRKADENPVSPGRCLNDDTRDTAYMTYV